MPRPLAHSEATPEAATLPHAERATPATPGTPGTLTGTVELFDPAMCCPTGVCGPGVDPALLQIARDLRWLTARGVRVTRVGLSQEPQAFVANTRVSGLLQAFGDQALPALLVNGSVLAYGRYPGRDELVSALTPRPPQDDPTPTASAAPMARRGGLQVVDSGDGSCTPGSGCC